MRLNPWVVRARLPRSQNSSRSLQRILAQWRSFLKAKKKTSLASTVFSRRMNLRRSNPSPYRATTKISTSSLRTNPSLSRFLSKSRGAPRRAKKSRRLRSTTTASPFLTSTSTKKTTRKTKTKTTRPRSSLCPILSKKLTSPTTNPTRLFSTRFQTRPKPSSPLPTKTAATKSPIRKTTPTQPTTKRTSSSPS